MASSPIERRIVKERLEINFFYIEKRIRSKGLVNVGLE